MGAALLLQLPAEILHGILSHVGPEDLASVPRACRSLHAFVAGNTTLWRDVYLRHLDDPHDADVPWEQALQDLVRLKKICASHDPDKKSELPFVFDAFTTLLGRSARGGTERSDTTNLYPQSRNADLLAQLFEDESNHDAFLRRSFLFERARGLVNRFSDPPKVEHQMSAKLHSLYGMPVLKFGRTRSTSRMFPFACSKVYDLRQYTELTRWGPFMGDGSMRVDWEKVEAVLIVLRGNIRNKGLDGYPAFGNFWNIPFGGSWPNSYLPKPMVRMGREVLLLAARDPYGVSGFWLRVVCFLDYNDFFRYNFPIFDQLPDNVPRRALDIPGATRLIVMRIEVTGVEPPGPKDGQALPVTHFKGTARSIDGVWDENSGSAIRGTCRLTPEGEVRWTSHSVFMGEERWTSEGIQLGGVRSARGIVGTWFDKDFDPHGPCGPTAFWKLSDPRDVGGEDDMDSDGAAAAAADGGAGGDILDMPHRDLLPLYVSTMPSDFGDNSDDEFDGDGEDDDGEFEVFIPEEMEVLRDEDEEDGGDQVPGHAVEI